jgi:DNA primase
MISDAKKEEIRDAADIVEVVSDYVTLKRSGSGFTGLCPYHNEKSPSFHVTPRLGIFKCFGCGESGDVFKFIMDQGGLNFNEALRTLADRFGVYLPQEQSSYEEQVFEQEKEGILHALKFAGVFFYRSLMELDEAQKARSYLEQRGYGSDIIKQFGLGYAPSSGQALIDAAQQAGIDPMYLLGGDLVKQRTESEGMYDTFRGRLMFPIFNPTGKVIAFAGRVLGNEKTAKYINSAQTKVYNKSEVVYGVNFSKNQIRKNKEMILVEGYTDVISLHQHGIDNVVASSGTALTPGQLRTLHRFGDTLTMIYDSDAAGQNAMKKGILLALEEGLEVKLLELPDGEDPDSFVKQFGKESFDDFKHKKSQDFVDFLLAKAATEGRLEAPISLARVINELIEAVAHIPDTIQRQVYIQHLHQKTQQYRKGTDRELFQELDRALRERAVQKERAQQRLRNQEARNQHGRNQQASNRFDDIAGRGELGRSVPDALQYGHPVYRDEDAGRYAELDPRGFDGDGFRTAAIKQVPKPHYEKELIRIMISFGRDMVGYVGGLANEKLFEDQELRVFYLDIIERYKAEESFGIEYYSRQKSPYPELVGDIFLEIHTASTRHHEKTGIEFKKDKDPYRSVKGCLKALEINYFKRKRADLAERFKSADTQEKKEIVALQSEIQKKITDREQRDSEELYPDPVGKKGESLSPKSFHYVMKKDREKKD